MSDQIILAAGGVLWRINGSRELEIALIHRPRYNDWTLPKGKVDLGESLIQAAFREILEETNIKTRFGRYLGHVEYQVATGLKQVHYWSARAISPISDFIANEEVDEILWLSAKDAKQKLTRESDQRILEKFRALPPETSTLILLRHAKAISRSEWTGEDEDRPLAPLGDNQSHALANQLAPFAPDQIFTSDAVRCLNTVIPLGEKLSIKVKVDRDLSEYKFNKNEEKTLEKFKDLSKESVVIELPIVICSHNPILPIALKKLLKKSDLKIPNQNLEPGDAWVLTSYKKEIIQVDYLPVPKI